MLVCVHCTLGCTASLAAAEPIKRLPLPRRVRRYLRLIGSRALTRGIAALLVAHWALVSFWASPLGARRWAAAEDGIVHESEAWFDEPLLGRVNASTAQVSGFISRVGHGCVWRQ